jgi:alginate production protein
MTHKWLMASITALCVSQGAWAQTAPPSGDENKGVSSNESLFGDNRADKDKDDEFRINGRLTYETKIFDNDDLADGVGNQRVDILPEARVEFTYEPSKDFEAYLALEAGVDFERRGGRWQTTERLEVREAFILIDDSIADDVEFQIGRQHFKDRRKWLYGERLDGVRLAYDHKAWRVEIAYAREELVPKDVINGNPGRDKVDNYIFHAEYEVTKDWDLSAYVMKQDDRKVSSISPLFFGIQSEGKIGGGLGHWFELSVQRGTSGTRKLRGNAIDAGLIYTLPSPISPAIFAGYARGSGGRTAATDRRFRQTGLQDNEDRITGLGNVHYYGEVLDPDLSNLHVYTLGFGIRPSKASSIELIGHKYRQVKLDNDDVRGSPINAVANGLSRDLGKGLDLIGAVRLGRGFGLEAKLGWFKPGKAFDAPARDNAFLAKIRLVYRF